MRYCLVAVDFLPAGVIRASMLRLCAEFATGALRKAATLTDA